MTTKREAWLPNLAGGVSVWNLADDLNRPEFFGGRLLVPILHGPVNLPHRVEWNLSGLVPLADARVRQPTQVNDALLEFLDALERTSAAFQDRESGYSKFSSALTVPSLDSAHEHYYFDPREQNVVVKNWGASPRDIAQRTEHVIDFLRLPALIATERQRATPRRVGTASVEKRRRWIWLLPLAFLPFCGLAIVWWPHAPDLPEVVRHVDGGADAGTDAANVDVVIIRPPPIPAPHQKIYFALGDSHFTDDQLASMEAIGDYLEENASVLRLLVEGHADFAGTEPNNQRLSEERAIQVRDWLIVHHIDPVRLEVAGCSELFPLAPNTTLEGRHLNRRVEFFVTDPVLTEVARRHDGCTSR